MLSKHLGFVLAREKVEKQLSLPNNTAAAQDDCQKVCEDVTQFFLKLANEPSLAYYRIQEHIRKVTPTLLDERSKVRQTNSELQGCCFDIDYSISAVNSTARAIPHLCRLNELLKSSLFTKLQLDYAQKYSTGFELGVDLVSTWAPEHQPAISVTSRKKIPTEPHSPLRADVSGDGASSPYDRPGNPVNTARMDPLVMASTSYTTTLRQNPVSLAKRALVTRSADISCVSDTTRPNSLHVGEVISIDMPPSASCTHRSSLEESAETGIEALDVEQST